MKYCGRCGHLYLGPLGAPCMRCEGELQDRPPVWQQVLIVASYMGLWAVLGCLVGWSLQDLNALSQRDDLLVRMGLPVGKKYFYDTYNIPEPAAEEETVAPVPGMNFPSPLSSPQGGEGRGAAFAQQTAHPLDPMVDRLMREGARHAVPLLDPIRKLVDESESLEDLRDKLLDRYNDMDPVALGNLMQRAFAAAELAGRFQGGGR